MTRAALVTGGSRGIGRAIARALAASGRPVTLTYRTQGDRAREVVEEIRGAGGSAVAIQMTVEERDSVRRAVQEAARALGPITVLVNNAAISQEKPFASITDEDWDRMLAVNLRGPFACCQEVLPGMLEAGWGRIVNITSIGGQWGGMNQVHYAAAKAGLVNLTRSLARLYAARGITANAVAIGLVATDMTARELDSEAGRNKVRAIPLGRIATPDEVAQVAVFLASEASSYVTGQTVNVNGGMLFG